MLIFRVWMVKKWDANTQGVSTVVSSGLVSISNLAMDSVGNLYIADYGAKA